MEFVRKKISSIFTKLLLVIIVTGVCINIIIGGVFTTWFFLTGRRQMVAVSFSPNLGRLCCF